MYLAQAQAPIQRCEVVKAYFQLPDGLAPENKTDCVLISGQHKMQNEFILLFFRSVLIDEYLIVARHSLAHTQNALEVNVRVLFISALMHFTISHLAKEQSSIGAMNRLLSTAIGA